MKRIGFLADTHSNKNDGSDLPDQVLKAFKGVDLIVHLGDVGKMGIIGRLQDVAPVMVPVGGDKGYVDFGSTADKGIKVLDCGAVKVGICFNLANPDKKITIKDATVTIPEGQQAALLQRRFKDDVQAVAFGGTHVEYAQEHDGVLFFNPGSPTLPSDKRGDDDLGSVAVLDVSKKKPSVKLVRLTR